MKRHTTLKVNSKLIIMVKKRVVIVILSMLKQNLDTFLSALTTVSAGFSGAEIEQGLISAMYEAFAQGREFTQRDFIASIRATPPLSMTRCEQVTALRVWASQRARPAASSVAEYQRMEF